MRRQQWAVVGIACGLMMTAPATAGLYFTNDVLPRPLPIGHKGFFSELARLRSLVVAAPADQDTSGQPLSFSDRVRQAVTRLQERQKEGLLSLNDRIDLSAYYVLLGNYAQARDVLTPALDIAPDDFRVRSNMATVYHRLNDLERAIAHLDHALQHWPQLHPGWTAKQLAWYRRVEEHYLALLNGRNLEVLRRLPADTVDEIFPEVRFTERGADYPIGGMSDALRKKLPIDALDVVRQLLLWQANDNRLMWLYGELLNADGDAATAFDVLHPLVYTQGLNYPLLRDHRTALYRFREMFPLAIQYRLFYVGIPSPLGVTVYEIGRAVLLGEVKEKQPDQPDPEPQQPESTASWLPDWRPLLVGFLAGTVVGMLVVLQVRSLRRGRA